MVVGLYPRPVVFELEFLFQCVWVEPKNLHFQPVPRGAVAADAWTTLGDSLIYTLTALTVVPDQQLEHHPGAY